MADEDFHPLYSELVVQGVILRSGDKIKFRVSRVFLSGWSLFFRNMFNLPQPGEEALDEEIIDLSEDADTLCMLLGIIDGREIVQDMSLDQAESLMNVAEKYEIRNALSIVRCKIVTMREGNPLRIYGMAYRQQWMEEMQRAAISSLSMDLTSDENYGLLSRMDGGGAARLYRLHARRTLAFTAAVQSSVMLKVCNGCRSLNSGSALLSVRERAIVEMQGDVSARTVLTAKDWSEWAYYTKFVCRSSGCYPHDRSKEDICQELEKIVADLPRVV